MSLCLHSTSGTRSYYLKRRDRASYEFALASAAVVVQMQEQPIATSQNRPRRRGDQTLAIDGSRKSFGGPGRERGEF